MTANAMRGAFIKLCMPWLPMTKLSFVTCTRRCWTATGRQILIAPNVLSRFKDSYLDHARSVAIRMFPVSTTIGIAEGIETALSCYQVYGVNTWAVINSGFMKKFRVPAGVKHLIIFADMDKHSATGHAAAFECAHANLLAKNDLVKVSIRWPDNGDFNDMLMNGDQVREQVFYKKVAA